MADKTSRSDIWTKLATVSPRYIYAFATIVIIVFVLHPVTFPLTTSRGTAMLYDFIEKLPPGSVIVMDHEHTVGFWPECGPGALAVWQHAFNRPLKMIFVAFIADGAIMTHEGLKLIDKGDKKYGKDYVEVGFVAGEETGMAAFARDFTMPRVDYYGDPLNTLPLLQNVKSARDISLWFVTGTTGNYWALRQVQSTYGVPQATATTAGLYATLVPYLTSGQFVGMINSIRGGAEYENLIGKQGMGNQMMGAITAITAGIVVLVIIGNITYFVSRRRRV